MINSFLQLSYAQFVAGAFIYLYGDYISSLCLSGVLAIAIFKSVVHCATVLLGLVSSVMEMSRV